ncbi:unnamed protein product [Pedinophyceae sp. YPF-701]|nr:unnamed protein product [Pedinophyceae sp. YPF-701]
MARPPALAWASALLALVALAAGAPVFMVPAPCTNGVLDAGESGVDCGGGCPRCRPYVTADAVLTGVEPLELARDAARRSAVEEAFAAAIGSTPGCSATAVLLRAEPGPSAGPGGSSLVRVRALCADMDSAQAVHMALQGAADEEARFSAELAPSGLGISTGSLAVVGEGATDPGPGLVVVARQGESFFKTTNEIIVLVLCTVGGGLSLPMISLALIMWNFTHRLRKASRLNARRMGVHIRESQVQDEARRQVSLLREKSMARKKDLKAMRTLHRKKPSHERIREVPSKTDTGVGSREASRRPDRRVQSGRVSFEDLEVGPHVRAADFPSPVPEDSPEGRLGRGFGAPNSSHRRPPLLRRSTAGGEGAMRAGLSGHRQLRAAATMAVGRASLERSLGGRPRSAHGIFPVTSGQSKRDGSFPHEDPAGDVGGGQGDSGEGGEVEGSLPKRGRRQNKIAPAMY